MNDDQKNVKNSRYFCRECGYQFPKELVGRINKGIQVYCENCGYKFQLEGIKFKEKDFKIKEKKEFKEIRKPFPRKPKEQKISQQGMVNLNNIVQDINKLSYIVLIIVSVLSLLRIIGSFSLWYDILFFRIIFESVVLFIFGIRIAHFDKNYLAPLIKKGEYNKVGVSAFAMGILGCIVYGAGVVLLIKGFLLII